MKLEKMAPWNWFRKEDETAVSVPIKRDIKNSRDATNAKSAKRVKGEPLAEHHYEPMLQLHRDIDRLFDHFFRGFNLPLSLGGEPFASFGESGLMRPKSDLSAAEKEYLLTVEIPGVNETDVSIDISGSTLTIRGEKKRENEEGGRSYYRIERNYGVFERVLSLPDDVDRDGVKAHFRQGVLTVVMPRNSLPKSEARQVEIISWD